MHRNQLLQFAKYFLAVLLFAVVTSLVYFRSGHRFNTTTITSFEECRSAGYPILESYPEQCRTPDGRSFTAEVLQEEQAITVVGEIVCLPHRDTSGAVTMECAYGILAADGSTYYGLYDPEFEFLPSLQHGEQYQIQGKYSPVAESKYAIEGRIRIESVE